MDELPNLNTRPGGFVLGLHVTQPERSGDASFDYTVFGVEAATGYYSDRNLTKF